MLSARPRFVANYTSNAVYNLTHKWQPMQPSTAQPIMLKIDNKTLQTTLARWQKMFATAHGNHDHHRFAREWRGNGDAMLSDIATGQHNFVNPLVDIGRYLNRNGISRE